MERSVYRIDTCIEEVRKHMIGIRSTDQSVNRKADIFCIIASKDISEVSCGDNEIDSVAAFYLSARYQI